MVESRERLRGLSALKVEQKVVDFSQITPYFYVILNYHTVSVGDEHDGQACGGQKPPKNGKNGQKWPKSGFRAPQASLINPREWF